MGKAISNGDIFKKIGLLIYRDKLRIFIALIASVVSYYLTLYPFSLKIKQKKEKVKEVAIEGGYAAQEA